MPDFVTLKSNGDFRRLYNRGKAVTDPALVIYYQKNRAGICRIGITTSKKIGNAVERNRSRRVIRAALREVINEIEPCYDIVLVSRGKTKYLKSTFVASVLRRMLCDEGLILPQSNEK